jgi:hypothetical protein
VSAGCDTSTALRSYRKRRGDGHLIEVRHEMTRDGTLMLVTMDLTLHGLLRNPSQATEAHPLRHHLRALDEERRQAIDETSAAS